jgi:DNA-binding CsgD family transcriptional regulator
MIQGGAVSLLLTNHPTGGWFHVVEQQRKIVGRSDTAEIPIPKKFRTVSRRHAEVWLDHRGCWIRDLGSRVGTRVNLVWIDRLSEARLVPGDLIRLGESLEIQVVAGGLTAESPEDPLIEEPAGTAGAELTLGLATRITPQQLLRKHVSPAETEVMLWISRGYLANEDLGQLLHRSPHTVRTQVSSILRKLGLRNRGDIIGWLKRHGAEGKPAEA